MAVSSETGHSMADKVSCAFRKMDKEYGGPRQYLLMRYNSQELLRGFHDTIMQQLPPRADIAYHNDKNLTEVVSEHDIAGHRPMCLHPAMFSFHEKSSLKGHPEGATCEKLCDQILIDGFVSSGDDLLVAPLQQVTLVDFPSAFQTPTPTENPSMVPFSVGYVKGSARMSTLLAIISMVSDEELVLSEALVLKCSMLTHMCLCGFVSVCVCSGGPVDSHGVLLVHVCVVQLCVCAVVLMRLLVVVAAVAVASSSSSFIC